MLFMENKRAKSQAAFQPQQGISAKLATVKRQKKKTRDRISVTRRSLGQAESEQEFMMQLMTLGIMALFAMYFLLAVTSRS